MNLAARRTEPPGNPISPRTERAAINRSAQDNRD